MWNEVVGRFTALVSGDLTRDQVSDWARAIGRRVSFSGAPDPGLGHESLTTLRGVSVRGETLFSISTAVTSDPYFIRDADLVRWIADLKNATSEKVEVEFNPHVITLSGVVGNASLPVPHRGVDDLDFFERWFVRTIGGRRAILEHHSGTPPEHTAVYLDLLNRTAGDAVEDLLASLPLSENAISSRNPRFL